MEFMVYRHHPLLIGISRFPVYNRLAMNSTELPKSYDPSVEEPKIRERWIEANPFHADPNARGDPYCIVIPPPNVTASLHLGHALNNTLQDILIRYHRMKGCKTLWMPGTDHAGIATQTVVDKRLQSEGKPALKDYKNLEREGKDGRTQFIEKVQAWKDEYEADITDQLKLMGCSCDWDRQRFTMDEVCARAVREAFFQLFKDGLIYRGKRLVNWDPATQTALADDEVENEEIDGYFWYMKYPIVDESGRATGEFATVATTRPETMLGDVALAVNPHDEARNSFVGHLVRLPIVNRIIKIIADDYVVIPDPESPDAKARFASGFLKVTPAHDPNDWEIAKRHNLEVINIFAPDATISREHGWSEVEAEIKDGDPILKNLLGMDRYDARNAIVDWFRKNNLLDDVKPYRHAVGHSYRSHVAIEPYLSDQWYVRVTDDRLRGAALRAMAEDQRTDVDGRGENWEGHLRFYPQRYAKTFQTWHENLRDWCISRQLWWGHRIPVWGGTGLSGETRESAPGENRVAEFDRIEQWQREGRIAVHLADIHEIYADGRAKLGERSKHYFVCVRDPQNDHEIVNQLEKWGLDQDPDVLDTWFSSALWPMSTMGWPDPSAFANDFPEGESLINTFNPSNVLCTAREIITLWVSRMVMFNTYFLNRLPFHDVFIHAMIQDGAGRKMSKSLGNGVDPRDIIKSMGTDAMRFTLAQMTTQTQDVRMPVEFDGEIGANSSPKFEIGKRFCNKLWNAARFSIAELSKVNGHGISTLKPERLIDRWILLQLWDCQVSIFRSLPTTPENRDRSGGAPYRFQVYANSLYSFVWGDFCDWYLEGIKHSIQDDPVQQSILRAVISTIIRWLHPIMPFITESLSTGVENLKVQPHASVLNLDQNNPHQLVATAAWPEVDTSFLGTKNERSDVVDKFERVRTLVTAIREVRSHQNVPDRQKVVFHVADDATADLIEESQGVVEILAGLKNFTQGAAPTDAVPVLIGGVEHAMSNLAEAVDAKAGRERLTKRKEELEKQIGNLKGRLANENYVKKAPAHLVEETHTQLAEAEAEYATLNARQENAV